jgi:hypothetical protein
VELVAVVAERPPVNAVEVTAPDRAIPAPAEVALHPVVVAIVGQLAQRGEVRRAVFEGSHRPHRRGKLLRIPVPTTARSALGRPTAELLIRPERSA